MTSPSEDPNDLHKRGSSGFSYLHPTPEDGMRLALAEALKAAERGEVPVGCVIFHAEHGVIARAGNDRERLEDPTAHAEILAISQAAEALSAWRLIDTTLYVTLEPCAMCAGAIVQARIPRVVYGATDPKAGAVTSKARLFEPGLFNHDVEWMAGINEQDCSQILRDFFAAKRKR